MTRCVCVEEKILQKKKVKKSQKRAQKNTKNKKEEKKTLDAQERKI